MMVHITYLSSRMIFIFYYNKPFSRDASRQGCTQHWWKWQQPKRVGLKKPAKRSHERLFICATEDALQINKDLAVVSGAHGRMIICTTEDALQINKDLGVVSEAHGSTPTAVLRSKAKHMWKYPMCKEASKSVWPVLKVKLSSSYADGDLASVDVSKVQLTLLVMWSVSFVFLVVWKVLSICLILFL